MRPTGLRVGRATVLRGNHLSRLSVAIILMALLAACQEDETRYEAAGKKQSGVAIFNATTVIQDGWRQLPIRGKTEYHLTAADGGVAIRAEPKNSASGLIRAVAIDIENCPILEWRWRVDRLQESADLTSKTKEDVAASMFLLFGDPGFIGRPNPVPTLRYVWTNTKHSKDDVIDSPYLPGVVRSIVIRTGDAGNWFTEKRDVLRDYEHAFGAAPENRLHAVALFTDNDQTREPALALYRWAKVHCRQENVPGVSVN